MTEIEKIIIEEYVKVRANKKANKYDIANVYLKHKKCIKELAKYDIKYIKECLNILKESMDKKQYNWSISTLKKHLYYLFEEIEIRKNKKYKMKRDCSMNSIQEIINKIQKENSL